MAYHCYHDGRCPACGRFYIRFDESEQCPACGSLSAPVYDLVGELVHYARLTLVDQGHLEVGGFQPSTEADLYVVLGYELLDAYRRCTHLEPDLVAAEAADHWRASWHPARCEHFRRFFLALIDRWRTERHAPLEPRPPAESARVEPEPETAALFGSGGRTYKKKWQPKEF